MPNIAQQDYIIIDWEGKDADDAAKRAEVDAQLKNLYLANPLALLSVLFKNYGMMTDYYSSIVSFYKDGDMVTYGAAGTDSVYERSFHIS